MRELFAHRHKMVVGVPSREILIPGGNFHCIAQQIPAMSVLEVAWQFVSYSQAIRLSFNTQ